MRILADENIPLLDELFAPFGELVKLPGRSITAEHMAGVDVLLVRSVTGVGKSLLQDADPQFVGTATIGLDHIDTDYLQQRHISYASAPGSNAQAVVDYVLTAIASILQERGDYGLREKTVGIIGLGNVGGALKRRLEKLGVACLANDPPLQRLGAEGLVSFDEVLGESDILSLHTPYVKEGRDATHHLIGRDSIDRVRPGTLLINTSRGAVVSNQALLTRLTKRKDLDVVLDVWENEPLIDRALLAKVKIATPHIAGYSLDGKIAGALQIYHQFRDYFAMTPDPAAQRFMPPEVEIPLRPQTLSGAADLMSCCYRLLMESYDIARDDRALRAIAQESQPLDNQLFASGFDALRKHYPIRREFGASRVPAARQAGLSSALEALGFKV